MMYNVFENTSFVVFNGGAFVNIMILEAAKQKLLNGDDRLAQAFYERAIEEGIPRDIVIMRKITKEYLLFPLDYVSPQEYFELLFKLKELAKTNNTYCGEYIKALNSLINIKKLFLRELSMYYFSELAVCYRDSLIVKHIYELSVYINKNMQEIVVGDCYELRYNISGVNMKQLGIDLLKIKAFCLNILLSYTAAQDSVYTGKTYHAHTYDYGWYSSTNVTSTDNYYNWAVIKPRLNLIGFDAYYDVCLSQFDMTVSQVRKHVSFDCPKELQKEISNLVDYKKSKDPSDNEFYRLAEKNEKEDYSRQSFVKTLMKFNYMYWISKSLFKKSYKKSYGMDEVGSFELDTYFTRKKIWGVCDMISCGSHWSIETVRWCMAVAGCMGIGLVAYLILGIAMKFGVYLPSITIEKH